MSGWIWQSLIKRLRAGQRTALMVVTHGQGSTPGRAGFKMLVAADGSHEGTVGGGIMEYRLVEQAKEAIAKGLRSPVLRRLEHRERAADPSGLICAGEQTVVTMVLGPEDADVVEHAAMVALTPEGLRREVEDAPTGFSREGEQWIWRERPNAQARVLVIGGGHVGAAVCRALQPLDFYVVNIDHREDVGTFIANQWADEKICCAYERLPELVSGGSDTYAVVVTTAFPTDAAALKSLAVMEPCAYVGLMGSKAKISRIFQFLREAEIPESFLARIAAPIGVGIVNHTPAEIAVSIAAQLIHTRHTST